ncbi:type I polyketide synthase [Acidithiobacillus sp. AC3]
MAKNAVAIIGQATRLPQRADTRFWQALVAGESLLTRVAPDRWGQSAFLHALRGHPGTSVTFAAGSLGDVAGFDAGFFRVSPREAAAMDPQQRLLLEMTWEALVQAGQPLRRLRGSPTGVFLGLASTDYGYRFADDLAALGPNSATGVTASIAANRLSYVFDWRGPSLVIDTACSSGLVAFHRACESLLRGECELALSGAINLHLHPFGFLIFSKASMLSASGRSRPFQEGADGYVRAEGGGIFLLKTLERARRDGDPILAVVLGTGNNTDGYKSGLTVPSAAAQASLLTQVYNQAGIDPRQLDYVEAHGTGTAVGDPIELEAIGAALTPERSDPLLVGSVKSNLGHLETASAVPGLLKVIHSLHARQVPPTIGVESINPRLPLDRYPLEIVRELRPLPAQGTLTMGVNSFGFGGANAHAILQSPPRWRATRRKDAPTQISPRRPLLLTAATEAALQASASDLLDFLAPLSRRDWERALYQLNFRHPELDQGVILWFTTREELQGQLRGLADGNGPSPETTLRHWYQPEEALPVAFVYSGNGCQWVGMGRDLLEVPEVAAAIDEIDRTFAPLAGYRLRDELREEQAADRYDSTMHAQPALFALQVAQTVWLRAQGIEPAAVIGHSVGEVAAAWACGALSLANATRVIHARSQAQEGTRGLGQMTAVGCAAESMAARLADTGLEDRLWLAADNSPKGCTVVGDPESLKKLEEQLRSEQIPCKRLPVDYPFHGPAMDALRDDLLVSLAKLTPKTGDIPFFSTVTGTRLLGSELGPEYWWQNVRQPVRFREATIALTEHCELLVELGGHPVLRNYLREIFEAQGRSGRALATLHRNVAEQRTALQKTLDSLWLSGLPRQWDRFYPRVLPPLELPNYPWQRERHWQEATAESCALLYRYERHPLLGHPVAGHPGLWEQRLDTTLQPWLADHQVGGDVLFPGAGFVELVLALGHQQFPEAPALCIEDLEILAPLVLEAEQSRIIRTQWLEGRLRVQSRKEMHESWTEHLRARLRPLNGPAPAAMDPLASQSPQELMPAAHYQMASRLGLQYGPSFQTVQSGLCTPVGVDAELRSTLPEDLHSQLFLDPGMLDGALQLFIDLLAGEPRQGTSAFVPVRIEHLEYWPHRETSASARVRLHRRSPHSLLARLQLIGASGQVRVDARGVRLQELRLPGKQQVVPRYFTRNLVALDRAESSTPLQLPVIAACCRELLESSPILTRRREEFLPLLNSYLQMYEGEQTGALWQTLLQDYPESLPWTVAAGRWKLRQQGLGEGDDPLLAGDWWRWDLQAYLPDLTETLANWLIGETQSQRVCSVAEYSDAGWELLPRLETQDGRFRRCGLRPAILEDERAGWPVHTLTQLPEPLRGFDALLAHVGSLQANAWDDLLQRARGLLRPRGILLLAGTSPLRSDLSDGFPLPPAELEEAARLQGWETSLLRPHAEEPAWILLLQTPPPHQPEAQKSIALLGAIPEALPTTLQKLYAPYRRWLPDEFTAASLHDKAPAVLVFAPELHAANHASPSAAIATAVLNLGELLRICREHSQAICVDLILPGALQSRGQATDVIAAALAAFVRTLANEWPSLRLRILDGLPDTPQAAEALAHEILDADNESEIFLDADGRRQVLRVQEWHDVAAVPSGQIQYLNNARAGQLRYLAWETRSSPAELPGNSVEVETMAAGLNFRDVMYALGLVGDEALEAGFAGPGLGLEFAGTVRRVGQEVSRWQVGDRVLGFAPRSLANRVLTPEHALAAIPEGLDWVAAAGLPTAFFTAWYALIELGRMARGERVLIHGAAGAVGLAAIQIAQFHGAEVFATAGSAAKRDFLRLLGVQRLYDSRSLDFADAILADTQGEGVDLVLNSLAGEAMDRSLRLLKPFGRFLELGKRDFYNDTLLGLRPMRNNLSYFGIDADQLLALHPQRTQAIFTQLLEAFVRQELVPLPSTIFASHAAPDAFRYMQQSRQIGKIVIDTRGPFLPHPTPAPLVPTPLQLDPEGVYVISGGSSGLGLATAQRLLLRGARKLALLSRQGSLGPEAETALQPYGSAAEIRIRAVDVRDRAAVATLFTELAAWGPLRGIIHAAAVIEDALADQLQPDGLVRVLEPKVDGAWHLHELSKGQPLDFFVLYSSIANLLGNVGQGAYVAANAALEALARHRHALGVPATTLQFGPIADVGYLTRHRETQELLQRRLGGRAISGNQALDAMEWAIAQNLPELAVADLHWQVLRTSLPWVQGCSYEELDQEPAGSKVATSQHDWRTELISLSREEALVHLQGWIAAEVAQILRLSTEQIDPRKKLTDLGFDSLMGMELVMALEERTGLKIPAFIMSEEPTVFALSQRLLAEWCEEQSAPSGKEQVLDMARRHGVAGEYAARPAASEV